MPNRPAHLTAELVSVWDQLLERVIAKGINPAEDLMLITQEESQDLALISLADVGGAEIIQTPTGMYVRPLFEESQSLAVIESPGVRAAAKPTEFS